MRPVKISHEVLACCLQQGVNNLHMLQLMPLLHPIISCFTEIQTRLTFLVLAYPQAVRAVLEEAHKRVSVSV